MKNRPKEETFNSPTKMAKIPKSTGTRKIGPEDEEAAPSPPLEELCFINATPGVPKFAQGCPCRLTLSESGGGQYSEAHTIVLCPKHRAKNQKIGPNEHR